jgi:hypothetical protein
MTSKAREPEVEQLEHTVQTQTANIGVLADSIEQLSHALEDRPTKNESRRFSLLLNFVTLIVVGIMVFVGIQNTGANRDSIAESKKSIDRSALVLDKLEDCLVEGGKCYSQGQARTAKAVSTIVCQVEMAIARGFDTAGLPPYELSPACKPIA